MGSREPDPRASPSVLDRLIDLDVRSGGVAPTGESPAEFRAAILRDLEWLLNTRRIAEPAGDEYAEVQRSVYHYGIPDISSLSGDSIAVRRRLMRQIEECIQIFEPRLGGARVTPAETGEGRHIRFVIEGTLRMDAGTERIVFDTVLETASGKFRVAGGRNA